MNDSTVKTFVKAIKAEKKDPSPYDTTAKVTRVEGNTVWVHISGGVDETPVKRTVNANVGDTVQVRVGGGSAWITGNATAPPTDDTTAIRAENTAITANENAMVAGMAASSAVESANKASSAAQSALTSATQAASAAASAQTSANNASQQAKYATNYANNALLQLGTVESVVDTLTWISEHSVFVPTTDSTVRANKLYYIPANNVLPMTSGTTELNGITYVVDAVAGTVTANGTATSLSLFGVGIPDATAGDKIWFSGVSGGGSTTYGLRYSNGPGSVSIYDGVGTATVKSSGNLYLNIYVASGVTVNDLVFTPRVATENEGFEYQIVENPTGNPASQGWFELSTDEAVKTYVKSHLVLTDDGLYILNDSSAYKMLLANDGTYIQAPNGQTVNQSTADGNIIRATNGDVIAHLGYGEGTATSGTADNPYYSLGTRTANSKIGNWSTSEGVNNTIAGYASHGEGADNVEYGRYNHIEGHNNRLRELYGYNLGGYAKCSHVEGENCEASGTYDGNATGVHVQNIGTIAKGDAQTAIGRYNSPDNGTDGTSAGRWGTYAFYIGNGTSDNARSNALTVDWSGNVDIASGAKYKINGSDLSASDVGAVPASRKVNNKALSSNITLSASDVSAIPTSDKYTRSSAGDLNWSSTTEGDAKVIAKSALAFWNGAYSGTSSNLSKCSTGNIIGSNGGTMTGQLLTSYKSSVAMGSYGSSQTTVPNFIAEVRMSSGCAGSVNIGTAYTANGVTIATGWYNFMYMPHRSGGKNGSADGDNVNYGNLFLFGMNNTNGRFIIRVSSGSIQEVSKIITTIEDKDYVTATGSDGIWKYRKWSSGRIECWGEKTWTSVDCKTSAGGGYRSADQSQALPTGLFSEIESCQATMKGSGGSGYAMALRTLCTTTTISQMFWNTSNATKSNCTVDYYIIGT